VADLIDAEGLSARVGADQLLDRDGTKRRGLAGLEPATNGFAGGGYR
jgi:hypothetical protein